MKPEQPMLGTCLYCHTEFKRRAMTKHLSACPARRAAIEQAEQQNIPAEPLYHLFVFTFMTQRRVSGVGMCGRAGSWQRLVRWRIG